MDYQKSYWNMLSDLIYARYYWKEIAISSEKRLKWLKIILMIVSCGGVTAFLAMFDNVFVRWISAVLVIVGQVVTALLPILGYEMQIRSLLDVSSRLSVISIMVERTWMDIAEGAMTQDEIWRLVDYYSSNITDIEHCLDLYNIQYNEKAHKKADELQGEYLENKFPVSETVTSETP